MSNKHKKNIQKKAREVKSKEGEQNKVQIYVPFPLSIHSVTGEQQITLQGRENAVITLL